MATISRTGYLLLCAIPVVCPGGTGMLRLLSYDNPTQQLSNGQCCDHYLTNNCRRNQCDPQFVICLNQQPASSQCSLVREESYVFNDTNTVTFNNTFGTASNPLHFNFSSWQTGFVITVTVIDYDVGGTPNTMDIMIQSQNVNLAAGPVHNGLSLRGARGRLQLEYSLECDPGYYGNCALSCPPKNNSYCSPSGTRVCLPGFTGTDCDTDIDECQGSPCINGGTCQDGNNSFTCLCPHGRAGQICNVTVSMATTPATARSSTRPIPVSTGSPHPTTARPTTPLVPVSTADYTSVSTTSGVISTASTLSTTSPTKSTSVIASITPGSSPTTHSLTSSVPTSPYQTNASSTTPSGPSSLHAQTAVGPETDNTGAVVGGVVGGLVVLVLVLLLAGLLVRKYLIKRKMTIDDTDRTRSTDKLPSEGEATTASAQSTAPNDTAMFEVSSGRPQ